MIHLEPDAARIFVRPGATDMRKQINGLVLLVQEQMQLSPFEAALFVFCRVNHDVLMARVARKVKGAAGRSFHAADDAVFR